MGGLVIETVRAGVQIVPDAAAAFRRADARVRAEFGRGIDVNSTYRSWSDQMKMFENWNAYVGGWGPYPGHSKAVHPDDSFHVSGLALDSDDWRIPRIVQILAEEGFIRNRLYVPGEDHHFEYIRSRDKNYGKPASGGSAIPAPKPTQQRRKHMSTGVIHTNESSNDAGNKKRSGAIVNTESGLFSPFGWFPPSYANGIAKGFGLEASAPVTRGSYNQIKADMAALRKANGNLAVDIADEDVPKINA